MTIHKTHPEIVKRLSRVQGHVKSIIAMLQDGRSCLEIAQQLQAVEKAISNAKKTLVHDHIDHCLENAMQKGLEGGSTSIREFKEITKYL
jgi:DNA-binding FrmR family transcriptional regulator